MKIKKASVSAARLKEQLSVGSGVWVELNDEDKIKVGTLHSFGYLQAREALAIAYKLEHNLDMTAPLPATIDTVLMIKALPGTGLLDWSGPSFEGTPFSVDAALEALNGPFANIVLTACMEVSKALQANEENASGNSPEPSSGA